MVPISSQLPISPSNLFPTQATMNLLSASADLPILDISFKWNHTMCGFCV